MTRRKFIRIAGAAFAIANLPAATRLARGVSDEPATTNQIGGITSNDKFYLTTYGGTPLVDPAVWRLKISGLVEHPLELSSLSRYCAVRRVIDECFPSMPLEHLRDKALQFAGGCQWRLVAS